MAVACRGCGSNGNRGSGDGIRGIGGISENGVASCCCPGVLGWPGNRLFSSEVIGMLVRRRDGGNRRRACNCLFGSCLSVLDWPAAGNRRFGSETVGPLVAGSFGDDGTCAGCGTATTVVLFSWPLVWRFLLRFALGPAAF